MKTIKILSLVIAATLVASISAGIQAPGNHPSAIDWISLTEAQQNAAEDGKPLFVFVEAEWCSICKRMLKNVFPTEGVSSALADKYHPVSIDLDSKNEIQFNGQTMTEREFARKMNVAGTPTTIFIDAKGEELGRQVGFIDVDQLKRLLAYVRSDQFFDVPLEEFNSGG